MTRIGTETITASVREHPAVESPSILTEWSSRRWPAVVGVAAAGGVVLGIIARAWMRLITTEPEFTWTGTTFIILGFTVFGVTQAIGLLGRRSASVRVGRVTRVIALIGVAPLFVAAGASMMPTVVVGTLVLVNRQWPRLLVGVLGLVALAPIALVVRDLVVDFGLSLRTVFGLLGFVAIYATIIAVYSLSVRTPPSRRGPAWMTFAACLVPVALSAFMAVAVWFG